MGPISGREGPMKVPAERGQKGPFSGKAPRRGGLAEGTTIR